MSFELIDHTADVGIRARGKDLEEAFEETARGMFSIITNLSNIDKTCRYEIDIEEDDIDGLLVNFLSELIYLHEVNDVIFCDFKVELKGFEKDKTKNLIATAFGEKIDLKKHEMDTAVKAVSYHDLSIDQEGTIEILFDV